MTPPVPLLDGQTASVRGPAVLSFEAPRKRPRLPPRPKVQKSGLAIITQRRDFLLAARAFRQGTTGFHLQARKREAGEDIAGIRVGFTCSKKVGNAVARGHAKRRLREVARAVLPVAGLEGWDYVLVGRNGTTDSADFEQMKVDLARAVARLHDLSARGVIPS